MSIRYRLAAIRRLKKTDVRCSLVQVFFPDREISLTYYNDRFDLKCGDTVFVEGKLEGFMGKVLDIKYSFKIRLADYKRVIAKADTAVKGSFYVAEGYMLSFDRDSLPYEKVLSWYKAPRKQEDEYACGYEKGEGFDVNKPEEMGIGLDVAYRGKDYYAESKVEYLCLDGHCGRAIVMGTKPYEVEFIYEDGKIYNLFCDCPCYYNCKHEFATMLLLKALLENIKKNYEEEYKKSNYFTAMHPSKLFLVALTGENKSKLTIE